MKTIVTLSLLFLMGITTAANATILTRNTPVYDQYLYYKGNLPAGTHIVLDQYHTIKDSRKGKGFIIQEILNPRHIRISKRSFARRINRQSGYKDYIIFSKDLPYPITSPPRSSYTYRETFIERNPPSLDRSYEVCYERPRNKVIRINEKQRRSGSTNMMAGIMGVIAGQAIGVATENRRLGNVISAVGVGFVAVGAVQVASSEEIFSSGSEINCKKYYRPDNRVYRFKRRGRQCSTTRYYSNQWGSEYEYFETRCNTQVYITFERSYEIYGY